MRKRKKNFEHNKIEICGLCKKSIDTVTDKWVVIIDYEGKKHFKTNFYHRDCLNDLLKGKGKVIQENFKRKLKEFTGRMLDGDIKKRLQNLTQ